jgi:NADH:ubiquinone oxidoreductase subunit E
MVISVCIGSSCHLKGSREVVKQLEGLIAKNKLEDEVTLSGAFCMGECVKGVCVKVEGELFSLSASDTESFFQKEVTRRLNHECNRI